MTLQRVPINNFRGGLNTRDGPFDLQPNESPDLLNVTISSLVGQLEMRKGKTRLDVSGMPESEELPDFMKQVVIGNEKRFLMLSINGGIYYVNAAGEVKKIFAGTAGTVWDFEVYSDAAFKDWVYCGNGVDAMQKWDGEAAATVEWKATLGTIPKGGSLCVWENRMFISYVTSKVERVYFSEFGDPEATLKEYGFVDVRGPEEDLDAVQDLAVLGSRLFVLKRRGVFYISSSVTMLNRRVGGPGPYGRFQTTEMEDKLYFFNQQGIWSTGGVNVTMESGSINNWFPKFLNAAQIARARICATRDTYPRILLAVATGIQTQNDKLIEMIPHINFRRIGGRRYLLLPAFMVHTLPASSLATWNPTGNAETVVGGSLVGGGPALFPTLGVTESFAGAGVEVPLSKGGKWKVWAWALTQGVDNGPYSRWEAESLNDVEGARWNPSEFTKTAAEIAVTHEAEYTIYSEVEAKKSQIAVHACYDVAARSGYTFRVILQRSPPGVKYQRKLILEKWEAGVKTVLAEVLTSSDQVVPYRIGITVSEGKVKAWINKNEAGWELKLEAADAKYNKGYAGFEEYEYLAPPNWYLANFRVGEIPNFKGRLYTFFKGTTDDGSEIEAKWQSSWMSIQGEEPKERVRRLNTELSGDAVVDVFTDFENTPKFTSEVPKTNPEGGGGGEYRFTRVRPETRGRFHSIRFRSLPGGEPFLINAAELAVRGGKEH